MGMSAWGLLAAPLMAHAQAPAPVAAIQEPVAAVSETASAGDIFSDLALMDDGAMRDAAGGADTAVDISNLGVNIAENNGTVEDTNVNNTVTGEIANNVVSGNGGITTVFNNTGNGVIFQSTVNVNIFTNGPQ